jgi:hypothetical protein
MKKRLFLSLTIFTLIGCGISSVLFTSCSENVSKSEFSELLPSIDTTDIFIMNKTKNELIKDSVQIQNYLNDFLRKPEYLQLSSIKNGFGYLIEEFEASLPVESVFIPKINREVRTDEMIDFTGIVEPKSEEDFAYLKATEKLYNLRKSREYLISNYRNKIQDSVNQVYDSVLNKKMEFDPEFRKLKENMQLTRRKIHLIDSILRNK